MVDSGHGGQTKDLGGDEADGYDEVIYPVRVKLYIFILLLNLIWWKLDFAEKGHITDDVCFNRKINQCSWTLKPLQEMYDIMVKPLPPGCRLTAIFDVRLLLFRIQNTNFHSFLVLPFRICAWYVFAQSIHFPILNTSLS